MLKFLKKQIDTSTTSIVYERINFRYDFNNKGYVKKVLSLYEKLSVNSDVVYYNDREMTEVPCIDREVLIISDYDNDIYFYTLVQVDFSIPLKYRVLLTTNSKDNDSPKRTIYNYIREQKLVEIKKGPKVKQPQIDLNYGTMLIEVLEHLIELTPKDNYYHEYELKELIFKNSGHSLKFIESEKKFDCKKTANIRFENRIQWFINLIYCNCEKNTLTIQEVLEKATIYQANYYYNI